MLFLRGGFMSVLLAVLYPGKKVADEVLESVEKLVHDGHLDLEDACVVTKDHKNKVHLHQENNLSVLGAVSGFAFGTFLGWFVWLPYLGIPGAILGAMAGGFSDRGISDQYMRDLGKEMSSGSSALFLLLRSTSVEVAIQELAPFGGRIFHTSLSKTQELDLDSKLQELQNKKAPETERLAELHK
jgi:uncharacterized membrane protein